MVVGSHGAIQNRRIHLESEHMPMEQMTIGPIGYVYLVDHKSPTVGLEPTTIRLRA